MKKIHIIFYSLIAMLAYTACEDSDNLRFTATTPGENIEITTPILDEYRISEDTENNIADRLSWTAADFGAPVNVVYEIQGSTDGTTFETIEETNETTWAMTVALLLDYADDLGLDDDPATTTETGNPNNIGQIFIQVRAYVGSDASLETTSDPVTINIFWIEQQPTGAGCDPLYAVGEGLADIGWSWDDPLVLTCENDVFTGRAVVGNAGTNNTFRFFTVSGDWGTGINYPTYAGDGYTIDPLFEDAMDGDNNFKFLGDPGVYDITIDDNAKTISIEAAPSYFVVGDATQAGWSWDTPVELTQVGVNVYEGSLQFDGSGAFRVFTVNGDWGSGLNYPYYSGEGYTIDSNLVDAMDGDNNFSFTGTPGTYTFTLDENAKTITLQ